MPEVFEIACEARARVIEIMTVIIIITVIVHRNLLRVGDANLQEILDGMIAVVTRRNNEHKVLDHFERNAMIQVNEETITNVFDDGCCRKRTLFLLLLESVGCRVDLF